MEKVETLREFYNKRLNPLPDTIRSEFGHFDVFRFNPDGAVNDKPVPYKKRDYFKIALMMGKGKIHLADEIVEVNKQALVFSNPLVPSKWEREEQVHGGAFCVFNPDFLYPYWGANQYPVFHANGSHVFDLTDAQVKQVNAIYERMFEEINSDYVYKYDVLRNLVMDLVHFAMKNDPLLEHEAQSPNASQRITVMFLGLLERQFSFSDSNQILSLRSPSDFASTLNVHVNHLNRSVKETMQKTTSMVISERILQESKRLLKQSNHTIAEIAHLLGFAEVSRFNNFFKKYAKTNPMKFRSA